MWQAPTRQVWPTLQQTAPHVTPAHEPWHDPPTQDCPVPQQAPLQGVAQHSPPMHPAVPPQEVASHSHLRLTGLQTGVVPVHESLQASGVWQ